LKVISIKALKAVKTTSNNEAINSFRVFETTVFYKKFPELSQMTGIKMLTSELKKN